MNEYTDEFRVKLQGKLIEIESLQRIVLESANTATEGDTRSSLNEQVAFKMAEFGGMMASVELWANEKKDLLGQRREEKKMQIMELTKLKDGKGVSATYAETQASLDPDILQLAYESRKLNHAVNVLKRKTQSIWDWLGHSRSRLTWVKNDIHVA